MSLDDANLYIWLDDNRFRSTFWNHLENQQTYVSWLSKKLNISDLDQWYTISPEIIKINKGTSIITKYENDMYLFLKSIYPSHQWFQEKFNLSSTTIKVIEPQVIEPQVIEQQVIEQQVIEQQVIEQQVIEQQVIEQQVEQQMVQPQVDCKVQ